MDVRRPGLAQTGPSSTALNYGCAVYPRAENRLIGIIGSRACTQIDRRLDVSPEDYLASQVAVEKGAIQVTTTVRMTSGTRSRSRMEYITGRVDIRGLRITFTSVTRNVFRKRAERCDKQQPLFRIERPRELNLLRNTRRLKWLKQAQY